MIWCKSAQIMQFFTVCAPFQALFQRTVLTRPFKPTLDILVLGVEAARRTVDPAVPVHVFTFDAVDAAPFLIEGRPPEPRGDRQDAATAPFACTSWFKRTQFERRGADDHRQELPVH